MWENFVIHFATAETESLEKRTRLVAKKMSRLLLIIEVHINPALCGRSGEQNSAKCENAKCGVILYILNNWGDRLKKSRKV